MNIAVVLAIAALGADVESSVELHGDGQKTAAAYAARVIGTSLGMVDTVDDSTAVGLEFLRLRSTILNDKIGPRAERFIGFLSGRLRVTLPEWWLDALRNGVVTENRDVFFFSTPEDMFSQSDDGCMYGGVDDVEIRGQLMMLKDSGGDLTIRRNDFKAALRSDREAWDCRTQKNSDSGVVAKVAKGEFAIAFECSNRAPAGPRNLFYGDAKTGAPQWSVPLMDGCFGQATGSWGGAYTEITLDERRVIVFGTHGQALTMHVFEKSTGKCVVLFVTSFLKDIQLRNGVAVAVGKEK